MGWTGIGARTAHTGSSGAATAVCTTFRERWKRSRNFRTCRGAKAKTAAISTTVPLAVRSMSDIVWRGESQQSTTGSSGPQRYQPSQSRTKTRTIRRFISASMNLQFIPVFWAKQKVSGLRDGRGGLGVVAASRRHQANWCAQKARGAKPLRRSRLCEQGKSIFSVHGAQFMLVRGQNQLLWVRLSQFRPWAYRSGR